MNNYVVVGIQHRQYESKKTGQQVSGYNIFVTYTANGVEGVACDSLWVSEQVYMDADIMLGDKVNVMYNRYGRVVALKAC